MLRKSPASVIALVLMLSASGYADAREVRSKAILPPPTNNLASCTPFTTVGPDHGQGCTNCALIANPGTTDNSADRSHGSIKWRATHPGGNGNTYYLVNVGNELTAFEVDGSELLRTGTTNTGIHGNDHDPFHVNEEPPLAITGHRYSYFFEDNGLWTIDGNRWIHPTVLALSYTNHEASSAALAKTDTNDTVICMEDGVTKCYYVAKAGTSIDGGNPETWPGLVSGSPYRTLSSQWSQPKMLPGNDVLEDPVMSRHILVRIPGGAAGLRALVDVSNPNPVTFRVGAIDLKIAAAAIGRVDGQIMAMVSTTDRKFQLFYVDTGSSPIGLTPAGAPFAWPNPPSGFGTLNLARIDFIGESGLVSVLDNANDTVFLFDVSNPAMPSVLPGVEQWFLDMYYLDTYTAMLGASAIGEGGVLVSGNNITYHAETGCDLAQLTCSFDVLIPGGRSHAFPGELLGFEATPAVGVYTWNFGDGGAAAGPSVNHSYDSPGDYTIVLDGIADGEICQPERTLEVRVPELTVSVSPPNAILEGLTDETTLSASHSHEGSPDAPYPIYNWTLEDLGVDVASTNTTTTSGGTDQFAWNFKISSAAADPLGYELCLEVFYNPTYSQSKCASEKIQAGHNAADFNLPAAPREDEDLEITDSSLGDVASYRLELRKDGLLHHTEFADSAPPATMTIPAASLSACDSPGDCWTAKLTVGDAVLVSDHPSGNTSSLEKSFFIGGSCISAGFSLWVGGTQVPGCTSSVSSSCTSGCFNFSTTDFLQFLPSCGDSDVFEWQWESGGVTETNNGGSIGHSYSTPGLKRVRLQVNGHTEYLCLNIQSESCSANYNWLPSSPSVGQTVSFIDSSNPTPVSWSWNFGDGTTSSQRNPNHAYSSQGSYNVRLDVVTSGGCSETRVKTINVGSGGGGGCGTPSTPSLITPSNGTTGLPAGEEVNHTWSTATNATSYEFLLYGDGACSSGIHFATTSTPNYTASGLFYVGGQNYSWQTRGMNSCGDRGPLSSCRNYSVGAAGCTGAPAAPSGLTPADNGQVSATDVQFTWSDPGTSGCPVSTYDLRLFSTACTGNPIQQFGNLATNSYTVGSIPNETYWNVVAKNTEGTSAPSACRRALVDTCAGVPPAVPSLLSPTNGAVSAPYTDVTFSWAAATCAATYDIYIHTGTGCTGSLWKTVASIPSTSTSSFVEELPRGADLSWSLRAANSTGSAASACSSFSTTGSGPPAASVQVTFGGALVSGDLTAGRVFQFNGSGSTPGNNATLESFAWDFGDGATASGLAVDHVFSTPGTYTMKMTVTQSDGQTGQISKIFEVVENPLPVAFLVPAAAHAAGSNSTLWRTDLSIFNPATDPLEVKLQFRPANQDNTTAPIKGLPRIDPGSSYKVEDVLASVFGLEIGTGALYVEFLGVTAPPVILSNTYNIPASGDPAEGSYGQMVPAIPVFAEDLAPKTGPAALEEEMILEGLSMTADTSTGFRTNLGLVNLGFTSATVRVEAWNNAGSRLAVETVGLQPFGQTQNSLLTYFDGLALPFAGYVRAVPNPGSRVQMYASVVDNQSGDGNYVSGNHTSGTRIFVPGMAAAPGQNDTTWASSLFLVNPNTQQLTVLLDYVALGASTLVAASLQLPPNGSVNLDKVVTEQFGVDTTAGMIRIGIESGSALSPPLVSARTYNDSPEGTFGQNIPAFGLSQTVGEAQPQAAIYLTGLSRNTFLRSNVGFLNQHDSQSTSYRIRLLDDIGRELAVKDLSLGPLQVTQLNDIFEFLLPGDERDFNDGTLIVTSRNSQGALSAYASVVDNATGDPLFVPGIVQ